MKTKLFFLVSILTLNFELETLNCFGQNWVWAKGSGGAGVNEGWGVATDPSGNVFVTGFFASPTITFGATTYNNTFQSTYDFFLVKYDILGNVLWASTAGGRNFDWGISVTTDTSGNAYVTGEFDGPKITFGTYTLSVPGGSEGFFLVKYNPSGTVLWAKTAVGSSKGNGVTTNVSGEAYVTGYFNPFPSTIDFGAYTLTNSGLHDVFIAKYNPSGTVLWAKSAVGTDEDWGNSVATDTTSGNTYITGMFKSSTISFDSYTLTNIAPNTSDIFLVKYDVLGNVLWAKSVGGLSSDEGFSLATDRYGNVYVAGNFSSPTIIFDTYTLNNAGSIDAFIAKYDALGNVRWAKNVGGTASDEGFGVATDSSGNVCFTGGFKSLSLSLGSDIVNFPAGGFDPMFVVKYDSLGNVLCASALASGGEDKNAIAIDPFGNTFIGGDFEVPTFNVGMDELLLTEGSGIIENVFVAKYVCSSILVAEVTHTDLLCGGQCTGTGKAVPIGGTGPYTYSWSNGKTTPVITGLCDGIYTVTLTDLSNAQTTFQVINISGPAILSTTISITVPTCNENTGTATAGTTGGVSPYSYEWSNGQLQPTAIALIPGTYTVTVMDANGCTLLQTVIIPQVPAVTATVIATQDTCSNNNGTASAQIAGGTSPFSYQWSNGKTTPGISHLTSSIYSVTITDADGCSTSENIHVNSISPAIINVSEDDTIGLGESTILNVSGGVTYIWDPVTGLSCTTCPSPVAHPAITTVYHVISTDANGCTSSESVTVFVISDSLFIPNIFTPNGDGKNDFFQILAGGYKNFQLQIFNRWGEKIFQSDASTIYWDGRLLHNNKDAPDGTYFYILNLIDFKENNKMHKGFVNLLR